MLSVDSPCLSDHCAHFGGIFVTLLLTAIVNLLLHLPFLLSILSFKYVSEKSLHLERRDITRNVPQYLVEAVASRLSGQSLAHDSLAGNRGTAVCSRVPQAEVSTPPPTRSLNTVAVCTPEAFPSGMAQVLSKHRTCKLLSSRRSREAAGLLVGLSSAPLRQASLQTSGPPSLSQEF